MIVQTENVFGAIAYSITKSEKDPVYAKTDADRRAPLLKLAPFFLSYIGNGDISRHSAKKVGAALQSFSPGVFVNDDQAECVARAFLDVAVTVTDNVY
jgi:hypothetical protein